MTNLGRFLDAMRKRAALWKALFFVFLLLLVALNLFITPGHPHVPQEAIPGFWPVFGLGVALVLIYLTKVVFTHIVGVSEDFYDPKQDETQ